MTSNWPCKPQNQSLASDAERGASDVTAPISVDAATVERLAPPASLVDALARAFAEPPTVPTRSAHAIAAPGGDGALLTMPAWRTGDVLGVKLVTVFPGNAEKGLSTVKATYVLMSAITGETLAIIDGTALTEARTAAISLLGRRLLSRGEINSMLMVGAGALAPHVIRAHNALRPLRRVAIWNRDPAKAQALAARLRAQAIAAEPAGDLEAEARSADLVSCATLSGAPLILGHWLKDGTHLDLIGGYRPHMREADNAAIAAGGLAVDTLDAFTEAGDLIEPADLGLIRRDQTPDLTALLRGTRPAKGRLTVFKSVGTAAADLGTAAALLQRLRQAPAL